MNNEVKYILQGCLLAMVVILTCNVIKFIADHPSPEIKSYPVFYCGTDDAINGGTQNNFSLGSSGANGQKLFKTNCGACHAINKRLVGPALAGVNIRGPWSDRKELYAWIHNPSKYMKSDPYTAGLFREYNGIMMQAFPSLSNKEIDEILDFIQLYSVSPITSIGIP